MHQQFKSRGSCLGHFIEECSEALVAAGKTVRFGWYCYNPLVPESLRQKNEQWLHNEIIDLELAIYRVKKAREWDGFCMTTIQAELEQAQKLQREGHAIRISTVYDVGQMKPDYIIEHYQTCEKCRQERIERSRGNHSQG